MILIFALFFIYIIASSLFFLWIMVSAWEDPEKAQENSAPKAWLKPLVSFSAIVAARHEARVIAQTIQSITKIDYPSQLKELIVVCRFDDYETIRVVRDSIYNLNNLKIKLVTFSDFPVNKPHALNIGLKHATHEAIVIFDAEDEPHKDIYQLVNTLFIESKVNVIQSGVQLMNFNSYWFSALNVLEYFFWFKSALHYFSKYSFTPLGGNTLFITKEWLNKVNGWDENCLTEDADVGVRLSLAGAKTKIIYDSKYATQEETPHSVVSFIKQRSRWNQGFIHILFKGDWLALPNLSQKILAFYIFSWPFMQILLFLLIPFSIWMNLAFRLPEVIALLSYAPLYVFLLVQITTCIGLSEFCREYGKKLLFTDLIKVLLFCIPYQMLLVISAVRSVYRSIRSNGAWEKTVHLNNHRLETDQNMIYAQL